MQVKLNTILADATRSAGPGDTITVSDDEGKDLIAGGYATEVDVTGAAKASVEGPPETATDPSAASRRTAAGKSAAA